MKHIEATGKTVELAVESALKQLELTADEVDVEVVSEGGLFKGAKVVVSKKLTEAERVQTFVATVVDKMGFGGYAVNMTTEGEGIHIDIVNESGEDTNIIGYRGEVLDSLQYLASLILNGDKATHQRVVVDSEGYRVRREKTLVKLAKNLEQKVKRTNQPVKLEPMNPFERRVIHTTLQNSQYVSTESDGNGNGRHVVISPKLVGDILNAPLGGKPSYNFVYRSEKKRRR